MNAFDKNILTIDESICRNIDALCDVDRGLLSQNILDKLRNFVEAINLKIYSVQHSAELNCYDDIVNANDYVSSRGELSFLSRFHGFLKISVSHYTLDDDSSIRLMIKYYEYLLRIQKYLKDTFDLDVLYNLENYPINKDLPFPEYYERIAYQIENTSQKNLKPTERFYVHKVHPFFVNGEIYYEITLTPGDDFSSKFNRFTVFSKKELPSAYAIKISFTEAKIEVLGHSMPIKIIDDFIVSIRQSELNYMADVFGNHHKISVKANEYVLLMDYLTKSGKNLTELVSLETKYYNHIKATISEKVNTHHIFELLDKCREYVLNRKPGSNLIRYLLSRLRNVELKDQLSSRSNNLLSYLFFKNESIPFDRMPFVSFLSGHSTRLSDVLKCIPIKGREHELLARVVRINTEQNSQLYTPRKELDNFESIEELATKYNNQLYAKHKPIRSLILDNSNAFINGYESDTVAIIKNLRERIGSGLHGFENSITSWLTANPTVVDSDEKKRILKIMFKDSNLALIYGAAGTGKTRLIEHISDLFSKESKLFITNTNPALENLRRRISNSNCNFSTIAKYNKSFFPHYDIVFVDESSTISNMDMKKFLEKCQCKLLVLVGDVYQIEAVKFGNWFSLCQKLLPQSIMFELEKPHRAKNDDLLTLWSKVRNSDKALSEYMSKKHFQSNFDESIFRREEDDEIILCLNYDGLYGINNMNRFLQYDNPSKPVEWGTWIYKVNDPVIFNEYNKFYPTLYNNLKGWIRKINKTEEYIEFDIEINMALTEFSADLAGFELLDTPSPEGHSTIRFQIRKYQEDDEKEKTQDEVVPFQVAYAVSIHKAQGLEFNSVKVIITSSNEEAITHNVFYTAITRACSKLKVYWLPETGEELIANMKHNSYARDANIICSKFADL